LTSSIASRIRSIHPATLAVAALIILYIACFGTLSVLRHASFNSHAYDLGNVDQAVWNTAQGRILHFTNWPGGGLALASDNRLAMHVEPILLPISLLYFIYSHPSTLLIVQTVVMALGALPAYWLARERLNDRWVALVFPLAYLMFPALQAANMWEFHAVAMTSSLLLFAFYYMRRENDPGFFLFAVLAMSCKEEIPLVIVLMGLYILAVQRRWRQGSVAVGLGAVWFYLAVYVIVPTFGGASSPYLEYFAPLGDEPVGIVGAAFSKTGQVAGLLFTWDNLAYLRDLFTPVAFTALLSPVTLAFMLPHLAIYLLSDHLPMHFLEMYHYPAPLVPFVVISGILGTGWLAEGLAARWPDFKRPALYGLAALILVCTGYYHFKHGLTPLARTFQGYTVTDHHRLAGRFIAQIPPEASVSAQSNLNPHVSQRQWLYRFPALEDARFLFLDASSLSNKENLHARALELLSVGEYSIVDADDGYMLLERGGRPQPIPPEFYRFATVENPQVQYPVDVRFGDALRLVGFDVVRARNTDNARSPLYYHLYWQTAAPVDRDYRVVLYLTDGDGKPVGSTNNLLPATVWYPTSRWEPGQTVLTTAFDLPWWTGDRERFGVGLAVMEGEDPWDVSKRFHPYVEASGMVLPVLSDGTIVELMSFRDDGVLDQPATEPRRYDPPSLSHSQVTDFQGKVLLLGYEGLPESASPGEAVEFTVYWQAQERMDASYSVFVHLLDSGGTVWVQQDGVPRGGTLPTTAWMQGEVVSDACRLQLPVDAPPGSYAIEVGIYDPATGQRLTALDPVRQFTGDFVLLGSVKVEP
jgi:uncharacterized membrane protein